VRSSDRRGEGWFTGLYAAHYPDIVRYGFRRLADLEAASELAQEVFVVAWRRRDRVPDRGLPWLYAVARRLLANEWRARRARPAQVRLDADLFPAAAGVDTAIEVWTALGSLSELDQEILRLVGWEQLTVSEAATVLGCSPATAAVRLHRARRRLSAVLGQPTRERNRV
jgi:RNA polymerase sigma factor (sigma-70 family)